MCLSSFTLVVNLKEGEFSVSKPDVHECLTPGKYTEKQLVTFSLVGSALEMKIGISFCR